MKIKRIAEPTPQQFNRNNKNNNKSKASNIMPAIIRFNESTMNLCMDKSWWSAINYHAFITALVYTTHTSNVLLWNGCEWLVGAALESYETFEIDQTKLFKRSIFHLMSVAVDLSDL